MPTYTAICEQTESGTWAGYVPDLPAILAVGDTKDELRSNMQEAIALWIEETLADGNLIPPPTSHGLLIDVNLNHSRPVQVRFQG